MNEISILRPIAGDMPGLYSIWTTVFGDSGVDAFFTSYAGEYICVAAITDGAPVTAGYLIPHGNLISGSQTAPCAMIYSVATLPEYRSLGLGAAVVGELISAGRDMGYEAIVLCPSDDSLFAYYSACAGFNDWFYVDESVAAIPEFLTGSSRPYSVGPDEYRLLREGFLGETPHIKLSSHALIYQDHLCREYGGGFFRIASPDGVCCAIVEKQQDGAVRVNELLGTESSGSAISKSTALSSIASLFPADSYTVRTPALSSGTQALSSIPHGVRRFGMLTAFERDFGQKCDKNKAPWYGPAFD